MKLSAALTTVLLLFFIASCTAKPEPFVYGKDICTWCKMGIVDPKFGSELLTKKGKVYKFDDIGCMINYMKTGDTGEKDIASLVVINFEKQNEFLDVNAVAFASGSGVKSPMGSDLAAFRNRETAEKFIATSGGRILEWKEMYNPAQ